LGRDTGSGSAKAPVFAGILVLLRDKKTQRERQVDWGEEGDVLAGVGIERTYSFHMTLSYSRDPFTCFTSSMDLATFWGSSQCRV